MPPAGVSTTAVIDLQLKPAKYTKIEFVIASSTLSTSFSNGMNVWANIVGSMNSNR